MDVGAMRNRPRGQIVPPDVCRRCKQPGHWQKDCPQRYDIRYAFVDELEESLARAKDTEELERHQQEMEGEQSGEQNEAGDFGTTSG